MITDRTAPKIEYIWKEEHRAIVNRLKEEIDKLEAENKRLGERYSYVVSNEIKNNASYTDRIQELEANNRATIRDLLKEKDKTIKLEANLKIWKKYGNLILHGQSDHDMDCDSCEDNDCIYGKDGGCERQLIRQCLQQLKL